MPASISHDRALDLAADRLGFQLSVDERQALEDHLGLCEDCRQVEATMVADGETLSKRIDWGNEQYFGEDDEYSPDRQPDEGIKLPSDDGDLDPENFQLGLHPERGGQGQDDETIETNDEMRRNSGGGSSQRNDESSDGESDEDDEDDEEDDQDDDATETPARGSERDSERPGRDSDDDDDEGDEADGLPDSPGDPDDEEHAEDEGMVTRSRRTPGQSAEDDEDDEDDEDFDGASASERMRQILEDLGYEEVESAVDAMSDQELGDVEGDVTLADTLFPACVADGVEAVARDHGVSARDADRKAAEMVVRADEFLEKSDFGRVAVYKSTRGILQRANDWNTGTPSPAAAAAVRNAILRSRSGHTGVDRGMTRGRLDSKSVHRIAQRDGRLFKRLNAPDPGKFLVWVLVDCSGSMGGYPIASAASVAHALAEATTGTPSVRMAVWGWTDPFRRDEAWFGAVAGAAKVWESGMPTSEVFKMTRLNMGGTPDATILSWAWQSIRREARSDETPVILMCSDGQGDTASMPSTVEKARKHGVVVKSVSFGRQVKADYQERVYGPRDYVEWAGGILETARPLATMIGRMAAGM